MQKPSVSPRVKRMSRGYPLLTRLSKGGPFEISLCDRLTMPFCRECGKEVQEDWISCPYCSKPIGPPASNSIGLKDSVVMGDVSIADSSVECARCKSTGVTITACMVCQNPAFCSVCADNIYQKRDFVCGEYHYDGNVDFHEGNVCDDCFDSIRQNACDGSCSHCGICIVLEYSDDGECCHCIGVRNDINHNEGLKKTWMLMNVNGEYAREVKKFSRAVEKYRRKLNARKKS